MADISMDEGKRSALRAEAGINGQLATAAHVAPALVDQLWNVAMELEGTHGTMESIDFVVNNLVESVSRPSDELDDRAMGALIAMSTLQFDQLKKLNEHVVELFRIVGVVRQCSRAAA